MLAENEQVIVKMRLARRELPSRQMVELHGAVGAVSSVVARNDIVFVGHFSSGKQRGTARRRCRVRCPIRRLEATQPWLCYPARRARRWAAVGRPRLRVSQF